MNDNIVLARIFRFNPQTDETPRFQEYRVPYRAGMTIVALLRYVYEELDPTLAFRYYRCGRGYCACCKLTVNGKQSKGCHTVIVGPTTVTIEPANEGKVIRDLVMAM